MFIGFSRGCQERYVVVCWFELTLAKSDSATSGYVASWERGWVVSGWATSRVSPTIANQRGRCHRVMVALKPLRLNASHAFASVRNQHTIREQVPRDLCSLTAYRASRNPASRAKL